MLAAKKQREQENGPWSASKRSNQRCGIASPPAGDTPAGGGVALWPYPWLQACSPDLKLGPAERTSGVLHLNSLHVGR